MPIEITSEAKKKLKNFEKIRKKFLEIDEDYRLFLNESSCLSLQKMDSAASKSSLCCDFLSSSYLTEVRQNFSKSDSVYSFVKPLAKKLNSQSLKILDLTAGLGRDLFKFVLAGHSVTGYEKDPMVFALLSDGVERFFQAGDRLEELKSTFKKKMNFSCDVSLFDSVNIQSSNEKWDLIYFDPMFEDDKKRAKAKKHMQFLKNLNLAKMSVGDKEKIIENSLPFCKKFVLKSSVFKSNHLKSENEIKGKGFSYFVFNGKLAP